MAVAAPVWGVETGQAGYPDYYDPRAYGAVCDGSTDDRAAFQAAIDEATTAGGTVYCPDNHTCVIGGVGLVMKDNVRLVGTHSCTLQAATGISAEILNGSSLADITVQGVRFDISGEDQGAMDLAGTNMWVLNNYVSGLDAASGSGIASVDIDCTSQARKACIVRGNTIVGTNTSARTDIGLLYEGGGTVNGYAQEISANEIIRTGGDGIQVQGIGTVTSSLRIHNNTIEDGHGYGIALTGLTVTDSVASQSIISDNNIHTVGTACILTEHSNVTIANNTCHLGPTWGVIARNSDDSSNLAGVLVQDNYLAGLWTWFDSQGHCSPTNLSEVCDVTADCSDVGDTCINYTKLDHNSYEGNVASGGVICENCSGTTINDNTLLCAIAATDSSTDPRGCIEFHNPDSTVDWGNSVDGNQINSQQATAATDGTCIRFEDPGGGGFQGITISDTHCGRGSNSAGFEDTQYCVDVQDSPSTWDRVSFIGLDCSEAQTGSAWNNDPGGTRICGSEGFDVDACTDRHACRTMEVSTTGTEYFMMVAPDPMTITGVSCVCVEGGTCGGTLATFALEDAADNAMTISGTLTCGTGTTAANWNAVTAGNSLVKGETFRTQATTTPTTAEEYAVCVEYVLW